MFFSDNILLPMIKPYIRCKSNVLCVTDKKTKTFFLFFLMFFVILHVNIT